MESFGIPIWPAVLAFARIGSLAMLLPGLGETFVSARFRLGAALLMAFVLAPTAAALSPEPPKEMGMALGMVFNEMLIGLCIGAAAKTVMSALAVAGQIISLQTGLAMGTMFDPSMGGQSAQLQAFVGMLGLALAMAANVHHALIEAAWTSYQRFPPGAHFAYNDWAEYAVQGMSDAFLVAVQMTAPILIFSFLYYSALGYVSRMLPQIQLFFATMPANVLLGLFIFMLTLGVTMSVFMDSLERFAVLWK